MKNIIRKGRNERMKNIDIFRTITFLKRPRKRNKRHITIRRKHLIKTRNIKKSPLLDVKLIMNVHSQLRHSGTNHGN